jgi:hypothetical protein
MHCYVTSYWNHIEVSASCLGPTEMYFPFKFRSYFYFQVTIFAGHTAYKLELQ